MALYRITMIVADPERTITTQFAGCDDETDAKQKARRYYKVIVFKRVELVIKPGE